MPDSYAWKGGGKTKHSWPILAFLVRHPEGTILIDSGCNPAFGRGQEREYAGWIYPIAKFIFEFPTMAPDQDVGSQLGQLGIEPGSLLVKADKCIAHSALAPVEGIGSNGCEYYYQDEHQCCQLDFS